MRAVEFKNSQKGEVSIFLCLLFLILISLVGALMESVSVHLTRNERRMNLEMAIESVFAEYDSGLLDEYDIFALDGTYGTGEYEEKRLLDRMDFYGATDTENDIFAMEFLTDNGGASFYREAVQYMRNQYGLPENASENESDWASGEEEAENYMQEVDETQNEIESKLAETEESLPAENNPIAAVEDVKKQGLVKTVLPQNREVSNLSIQTENLPSVRVLREGNYSQEEEGDVLSDVMFREYLLEHFYSYGEEEDIRTVSYEMEYLLCGKEKDAKNLEKVLQRILLLRVVPNYACLLTDTGRKTEANALAASLCSVLSVAGLTPIVEQAILLAWAYGESVAELQILMDGGQIASIKTKESWILSLAELPLIGSERHTKEDGVEQGMSYEEYLRILLLLSSREELCMRALDLIECHTGLLADACVTRVQIASTCLLRRQLTYEFRTQYGYR